MKRTNGIKTIALIECINHSKNKWRVRWDIRPDTEIEYLASYIEAEFNHKPTIEEVKEVVFLWINSEIDKRILSDFVWNDLRVWLSSENQFNYKAAYDLAVQTNGASLPMKAKFGDDNPPQYHEFTDLQEFSDFYMSSIAYIQSILNEGWDIKDNFDFSPYEELLNTL